MHKNSVGLLFGSSTSSNRWFLWPQSYFTVITFFLYMFLIEPQSFITIYCSQSHYFHTSYINHIYIIYSAETSEFILSFTIFYSLNTLFTETNSSWLIKDLEIKTSIVRNLVFPRNFIMHFLFSLDNWLILFNFRSHCTCL